MTLTNYFRFTFELDGYPPIRVTYSRVEKITREFEEYYGYLQDPEFGAGWKFDVDALDFDIDHRTDDTGYWYYAAVTSGISTSLCGAHEAAKGCLPKEAWPFISHQLFGRRETFNFALEHELVHGPDALREEVESGWLEKFQFHAKSLEGDPEQDWGSDDD